MNDASPSRKRSKEKKERSSKKSSRKSTSKSKRSSRESRDKVIKQREKADFDESLKREILPPVMSQVHSEQVLQR